ncbi:DUF4296 domain-containing protein [Aquimarina sp. MMG016]|uniref:DUF4296 domain-containing protein n=1 Tax=Aquimarina sp. MMG016 TaxID=2822690 RepID=UPI001B3A3953|nr:DUF4296 domain-containing protein [Aquimarina sp. MMG016]MBQ4819736.1 DUF4296 domain-containing protein [Aquimarina sp. MMG016]
MIKKIIFFFTIIVFLSCQSVDKVSKPDNLISEDKMVEMLTEIAFIKASKSAYRKVLEQKKINPEAYILKKHGVDSLVFANSNAWYTSQLKDYQQIFARVKNNLEKEKLKYEKQSKKEDSIKKIADSIKGAKGIELDEDEISLEDLSHEELMESEIIEAKKKRFKSALKKQ